MSDEDSAQLKADCAFLYYVFTTLEMRKGVKWHAFSEANAFYSFKVMPHLQISTTQFVPFDTFAHLKCAK
jgi:hypothetical protein